MSKQIIEKEDVIQAIGALKRDGSKVTRQAVYHVIRPWLVASKVLTP